MGWLYSRVAERRSSRKPLCTTLHNLLLQLEFLTSWRFPEARGHHNLLWRRIRLRTLEGGRRLALLGVVDAHNFLCPE